MVGTPKVVGSRGILVHLRQKAARPHNGLSEQNVNKVASRRVHRRDLVFMPGVFSFWQGRAG